MIPAWIIQFLSARTRRVIDPKGFGQARLSTPSLCACVDPIVSKRKKRHLDRHLHTFTG
jgi:hypothetical protein